jgi:hypothetical protein
VEGSLPQVQKVSNELVADFGNRDFIGPRISYSSQDFMRDTNAQVSNNPQRKY